MTTDLEGQMSGTAEGLLDFLDWAESKGVIAKHTCVGYRTAVTKVFEIDADSWRTSSIKELDVDLQLERFVRLRGSKYNPESLKTYGNRFRAAVSSYLKYLEDPVNFRGVPASLPKAKKPAVKVPLKKAEASPKKGQRLSETVDIGDRAPRSDESDLVQYPFPLRNGVMAYLSLPRDLRKVEASRIGAFVASLAIDTLPELGVGAIEH